MNDPAFTMPASPRRLSDEVKQRGQAHDRQTDISPIVWVISTWKQGMIEGKALSLSLFQKGKIFIKLCGVYNPLFSSLNPCASSMSCSKSKKVRGRLSIKFR
jgi:hypothetical protein